jgi:hypothetical protein
MAPSGGFCSGVFSLLCADGEQDELLEPPEK